MSVSRRLSRIWHSYRSLPAWVQWWVGSILVPINALPFLFLDTWSGRAGAAAALVVVATNLPIMWVAGGMTRAMSLPHLVAWVPLEIALILRVLNLTGTTPPAPAETWLALLLIAVNAISLAFDILDSLRWWRGEREIAGFDL